MARTKKRTLEVREVLSQKLAELAAKEQAKHRAHISALLGAVRRGTDSFTLRKYMCWEYA